MLMLEIILSTLVIVVGFAALIKGADALVDGATYLAKRIGVSELLIGLTIVAFGTSLPELVVSILSVVEADSDLAVGNLLGSNITNIFLVLGVGSLLHKLQVKHITVWREVLFAAGAGVLLLVLVADQFLGQSAFVGLDGIDGIVLLTMFFLFLYYSFGSSNIDLKQAEQEAENHPHISIANMLMMILLGTVGLVVGGQLIIYGSQTLAGLFGIADGIIGLTIVALGTSAPELAAVIAAVRKQNSDIAIGTVVGSNLFNTLWVLGLAAIIAPLPFTDPQQMVSAVVGAAAGLLLFVMVAFGKGKHVIGKPTAALFLTSFVAYYAYLSLSL